MNDKAFLNLQVRIANSSCFMLNGAFNKCCFVALLKTVCLERQLLNAYFHLSLAQNYEALIQPSNTSFDKFNGELGKLIFLSDSIVAYNNCIDTVLQVLYFGLEFIPEFRTHKEYETYVRNCNWNAINSGLTKVNKLYPEHAEFIDKTKSFYEEAQKIRECANAIKHHGGIVSLHTQLPCPNGNTINLDNSHSSSEELIYNEIIDSINNNDENVFSPKSILPIEINFEEIISILDKQTSIIYEYFHYAFKYIGLYDATASKTISGKMFHPIFSVRNAK